jgi:branched-chain amino acid transport system substrate-binding protein
LCTYALAHKASTCERRTIELAQMRNMKINDFMTKNGWLREDGRVMRDMYLEEVKSPAESKYPFDYVKILATIPAEEAFRPLKEGGCPLVHG